ncbi:hypothetical protein TNCV_2677291 [Trichonephila clavipes]|nr:hypothetical protein TNCV_2677291 [Trichonephila clavipes]
MSCLEYPSMEESSKYHRNWTSSTRCYMFLSPSDVDSKKGEDVEGHRNELSMTQRVGGVFEEEPFPYWTILFLELFIMLTVELTEKSLLRNWWRGHQGERKEEGRRTKVKRWTRWRSERTCYNERYSDSVEKDSNKMVLTT